MLPAIVQNIFNRVRTKGENAAIKIETPDIVRTTHEIIDLLTFSSEGERPELHLVRPDRITPYVWEKADWGQPLESPIGKVLETIEQSMNALAVFIFWDMAPMLDESNGQPPVRTFIPQFFLSPKATRKLLIFMEPLGTRYPNIIAPYITSVSEHYPSKQELVPMVKREQALAGVEVPGEEVASALLGLTYTQAQHMLRLALDEFKGRPDFQKAVLDYLYRRKEQLLADTLGMNILKPTGDDIPYGLDFLMRDFEIHRHLICVEGQDREKGWLLIGTPGSGKSLFAKYLGHKLGYPAISFNISSIMNSLVGQTEKNMYNFCMVIETFAPCIVYIDEFEKALSSGQEFDGGTMTRALGILFTWLNDTNAPVFFLASANNLDPDHGLALTRRGRFSQLYWVGEPCRQARYDICRSAFRKKNLNISDEILKELADKTRYFSGADLVWLVNEIVTESKYHGYTAEQPRFRERLMELVEENRPRVETMKAQYDPLRRWARAYCKPAGLPPEE